MRIFILLSLLLFWGCNGKDTAGANVNSKTGDLGKDSNGFNKLTAEEEYVILKKGTEAAYSGKYNKHYEKGIYTCKRCDSALFESKTKFDSKSGWPSFDDTIADAVAETPDGSRTEIICRNCSGHLGHVFKNEGFTPKNTRHCVNSISMDFIPAEKLETAIFASGCFWGTEHWLAKADGVISTSCGYIGGSILNPTYEQVCTGRTGHAEAVEVIFDKTKTDFETLARLFFETHDPTQVDGQGPDIGTQYRSGVFYTNEEQKKISQKLIGILSEKGFKIATEVTKASIFYDAEGYHQDYYKKNKKTPYCHQYKKLF